jgi:hypothetical protein
MGFVGFRHTQVEQCKSSKFAFFPNLHLQFLEQRKNGKLLKNNITYQVEYICRISLLFDCVSAWRSKKGVHA